jgi:hypothetical protein
MLRAGGPVCTLIKRWAANHDVWFAARRRYCRWVTEQKCQRKGVAFANDFVFLCINIIML